MSQQVDHFPTAEFNCKAYAAPDGVHPGTPYPDEWVADRLMPLKRILETIRFACGDQPVTILCGYRTVDFNAELRRRGLKGERHATGVALHSQHTEGRAADITIFGLETINLLRTILDLREAGRLPNLGGVGYYRTLGFVHVDTFQDPSGNLRRWNS